MIRLPASVRPERYELHVHVDPRRDEFRGQVRIELTLDQPVRALRVHAVDLRFGDVRVEGERGAVAVREVKPNAKQEAVDLKLEARLPAGKATLVIDYTGPLRKDLRGLYLARSGKRRYAVTQLEATDARRFFPCFDEPDKKARFAIRATVPAAMEVLSNGKQVSSKTSGRTKTVTFTETPKLSTYLIALTVGDLEGSRPKKVGPTAIRVWCVPGKVHMAGYALEVAAATLKRLEDYFGLPYPYDKLDLIAVPDFEFGAMENAGAVIFRETLLLSDPKTITSHERKRVAEVVCHELAHMWYGNLVTMAWWDDLWLNEAFATWMAFKIVDEWQPGYQMWLDFEAHRSGAYALDSLQNTHAIYTEVNHPDEATENFDLITYEKGASVVRMVERWLGAAAFQRGVRKYIRQNRESNARAQDLWNALAEASGLPVAKVVQTWIERPGFPLVQVRAAETKGRAVLRLRQERFFASPRVGPAARKQTWPIPVRARVRLARGKDRIVNVLAEKVGTTLDLGPAKDVRWSYANAEESGFYRPLHDARSLKAICAELPRLAAAERMGLLGHQWAGVRAGRAPLDSFLDLAFALGDEPEPDVLDAALGPLGWIDDQLVPAVAADAARVWRERLTRTFGPSFLALGWKRRRGESEAVGARRAALVTLAAGLGRDAALSDQLAGLARAYLRDRQVIDADLAGPVVGLAARRGDAALYEAYLKTMRGARTPQERIRFAQGLTSFAAPELVRRTHQLLLSDDVAAQDVVPLLARMLGNRETNQRTWKFVRKSWKALSPRISTGLSSRLVAATPALQTRTHRKEVASFFKQHPLPAATRALKQALERFDLDADLRRRATPDFSAWLR